MSLYQTAGWNGHRIIGRQTFEYPIPEQLEAKVLTWPYGGTIETYEEPVLGQLYEELGGFLVGQGAVTWLDGNEMRYTRSYANIPPSWTGAEPYAYTFPAFRPTLYQISRRPFSVVTNSIMIHEYFLVENPEGIVIGPLFKVTTAAGNEAQFGLSTITSPTRSEYEALTGYALTVEINVQRWRGPIYERITRKVQAL